MPKGWTDNDPAKGTPHRRTREKIQLLLRDHLYGNESAELLGQILLKVAEKRPDDVLDAILAELPDED